MRGNRVLDYLAYVVVRILICIVQATRIETGQAVAGWLAWLFHDVIRLRGQVIDENLAHAMPDLSAAARGELARRMWEHLFLLVLEVAHAPRKIHETNWRQYLRLRDVAPLLRAMISGRPVIIVTAHFGNFELGGYGLGILGFPTYSVARPLDNRYLDRFLNRFRGGTGQHLISKNGGSAQIERVLSQGGTWPFWPTSTPARRAAGWTFSAAPPRPTRRSPCWRWNTMPRWPSACRRGATSPCGSR